jgi:hypothetical protein
LFQTLKTFIIKNVPEKSSFSKKGDEIGRLDGIVTNEKVKETCFQPLNKAELLASSGTAESEGRQMKQC